MLANCEDKNCMYWDTFDGECCDDETFIDPDTSEVCCRYYDGAISEEDYKELMDNCETELWDDIE